MTALQFGIAIVPAAEQLEGIRALVRTADEAALDIVGIQRNGAMSVSRRRCSPLRPPRGRLTAAGTEHLSATALAYRIEELWDL